MDPSTDAPVPEMNTALRDGDRDRQPVDNRMVIAVFLAIWIAALFRTAWMSDDAYFTLASLDNLVHGYGLRFNVSERVQAFTNPLWLLVLAGPYALTKEPFYTTIAVSVVVSTLVAGIVASRTRGLGLGSFVLLALPLGSHAFVDYATSGLENPLSHLLLALFLVLFLRDTRRRSLRVLYLLAGFAAVNRLDALVFYAPMLAYATVAAAREGLGVRPWFRHIAWGFAPLFAWELFSLVYFGSLVPNTALAKLQSGIDRTTMFEQGSYYYLASIDRDPLTLVTIGAAVFGVIATRDRLGCSVAASIVAHLLYVLWIGGDFMNGRFFTVPFLAAVFLVARLPIREWTQAAPIALLLLMAVLARAPSPLVGADNIAIQPEVVDHRGIADERRFYSPTNSLRLAHRGAELPAHEARTRAAHAKSRQVVVTGSSGHMGFYAPRRAHIVTPWALTDPLLSRLPAMHRLDWRPGHYERAIPEGYLKTLTTGSNKLVDPQVAKLYDDVTIVTRGKLWTTTRWAAIWRLATGKHIISTPAHRYAGAVTARLDDLAKVRASGTNLPSEGTIELESLGLEIPLDEPSHACTIDISVDAADDYAALFELDGVETGRVAIRRRVPRAEGLEQYVLAVPAASCSAGYDRVRIVPVFGTAPFVVGHVLLRTDVADLL